MEPETCDICRFDNAEYPIPDCLGTLRALGTWWSLLTQGVDASSLARRPAPTTWSASEYATHSAGLTGALGWLFGTGMRAPIHDLPHIADGDARADDPPPGPEVDVRGALDQRILEIDESAQRIARKAASVPFDDEAWTHAVVVNGERVDPNWILRHVVHDATHHLIDVGRGLAGFGIGPLAGTTGSVLALHASGGGVPKLAIPEARVGRRGIDGDRQAKRRHHGRVWQALCLFSIEVIEGFRAEGHPIEAGSTGENLTIRGIDWSTLRPGTRLGIGDEVVAEITVPALPCHQNARWFSDGDSGRMHHERHPGESRLYARVVRDGVIRTGDTVVVEP